MMGIGFGEMVLVAGIALVVIGPEKFPEFAKVVVRTIRDLRGYMDEVKKELADELKPVEREMRSLTRPEPPGYARPAATSTASPRKETSTTGAASAATTASTAAAADATPQADGETAARPEPVSAADSAGTSRAEYGAYSPEQDEDYDHTAGDIPVDSPEAVTQVAPPERLDG